MTVDQFDRAMAGESLTKDLSDQPFSTPPTTNGTEDAFGKIINTLEFDEDMYDDLISMMDAGVELESIANVITFGAFKDGHITPDTAMLIKPVLIMWMIKQGLDNNIKPKITNYVPAKHKGSLSPSDIFNLMEIKNPEKHNELKQKHAKEELEDFFGAIQDVEDEDRGETQPLEQGFMDMEPEEQEGVQ